MRIRLSILIIMVMGVFGASLVAAQDVSEDVYKGTLDARNNIATFTVDVAAGQVIFASVEATSGDLDTILILSAPNGDVVMENDDRSADSYDSALAYTAQENGTYTITLGQYGSTKGNFTLVVRVGGDELYIELDAISRLQLSGEHLKIETENFVIHYTLEGVDAVTEAYAAAVAQTAEEVWRIQIEQLGWQAPPSDNGRGGDERYDIYLSDLIGNGEEAVGLAIPEDIIGDNPDTPDLVEIAATSYIVLENDFDVSMSDDQTQISMMRTTLSHEFHHAIQFAYNYALIDNALWYYEATSTWIETYVLPKDEDASRYVESVFTYPEVCVGDAETASGELIYGHWTLIQSLVDTHGVDFVKSLWENLTLSDDRDGVGALAQTLEAYDSDLLSAMLNYHVQNVVRGYDLAPRFGATLWLENYIDEMGKWTYSGEGIQELAANYYEIFLWDSAYYVEVADADIDNMQLVSIGIKGDSAEVTYLGAGGVINADLYDHYYLLVFNANSYEYSCQYYDYTLNIYKTTADVPPVDEVWDATYFEELY